MAPWLGITGLIKSFRLEHSFPDFFVRNGRLRLIILKRLTDDLFKPSLVVYTLATFG
jgi:hypothetical protein